MNGFKNIEINNLRGIDHLKIDDFSRVNILLGQNSSGKTTVLEGLFLLMGISNPDLPKVVNALRTHNHNGFDDLIYLFHKLDLENNPQLTAELFDEKRHLKLSLTSSSDETVQQIIQNDQIPTSETKTFLNTVKKDFEIEHQQEKKAYECLLTFDQSGKVSRRKLVENYTEKNTVAFITSNHTSNAPVDDLMELIKNRKESLIVERLALFDNRINGVAILDNVPYIGVKGVEQLMPVSMMGDGLRHYFNIVTASANPMLNILLIDEIDNGLHYSAYKKLWEAIFALATTTDKQVFVTTHSKETLYYLNEMLQEHSKYQQEMRLYTLAKTPIKGHQAYRYTFEGLNGACANDVELRGRVL